jgi:hypothetical protein
MRERGGVEWFVRCPDDAPGVTATGTFATKEEAEASCAEVERDFKHCSGPHTVESRAITEEDK